MPIRLSDIPETETQTKGIRLSDIPEDKFTGKPKASFYSEVVAPILEGGSTFAAGIPRMVAKAQGPGMEEATFPEQQTLPGKLLRGASEITGFTAGLPGQAAKWAGRGIGKAAEKFIPKFVGKALLSKVAQGAGAGAAGMATAGTTPENRIEMAKTGALLGGAVPLAGTGLSKISKGIKTVAGNIAGVDKEILNEVEKRGVRNVLQKKYYNTKIPEVIQDRITSNIEKLEEEAGNTYEELISPLKKSKFDVAKLKGDVVKIANKVKTNPFDTEKSKIDNAILDGIINKAKINNLGDALDLRRNLDDIIYSGTGELKTSFGKKVRDILNKELHKNTQLAEVDNQWKSLQEALREGKKVTGETGEKFLARFSSLPKKQKEMLSMLEKKIGGEPFIDDLTNWSLAQKFINKSKPLTMGDVYSLGLTRATKPLLRGVLRTGESMGEKTQPIIKFAGKSIKNLMD